MLLQSDSFSCEIFCHKRSIFILKPRSFLNCIILTMPELAISIIKNGIEPFTPVYYIWSREIAFTPAYLALSMSFTTAPWVASPSVSINNPSG